MQHLVARCCFRFLNSCNLDTSDSIWRELYMSKRYIEEEVLKKIREGQRVSEIAKVSEINDMTIMT